MSSSSNPLKDFDTSLDYYEILGVDTTADLDAIKKAYRKTALKYHPDKNPSASAAEKFHLLSLAHDLLTTPEARTAYDAIIKSRYQQKIKLEAMSAEKRKMRMDLEAREERAKKVKLDGMEKGRQLAEIERLRHENAERLRNLRSSFAQRVATANSAAPSSTASVSESISLEDRTIKVQWKTKKTHFTEESLKEVFKDFGVVESCLISIKEKSKKATGIIVFETVTAANSVVSLFNTSNRVPISLSAFEKVSWAKQEPQNLGTLLDMEQKLNFHSTNAHAADSAPISQASTTAPSPTVTSNIQKPTPSSSMPSFSFGVGTTPNQFTSTQGGTSSNLSDYETMTLLKMKHRAAERERIIREMEQIDAEENES
ncbi:hypothetical protein BKA69DRAFT_531880 [Paraphysoderma sedebokerense]|nr:hypothetical protein BKA69DRAFT_531880 [Paraphysoderma sedebokerense]